jgi:hypothetical protein
MAGLANEVGPKARSRELLTTASDELSLQAAHSRRSPPRSLPAALLFNGKDFCGNGSHLLPLSTSDFAGDGIHQDSSRAVSEVTAAPLPSLAISLALRAKR